MRTVEDTVLKPEDYNLAETFGCGRTFTIFNSFSIDAYLREQSLEDTNYGAFLDRAGERAKLSYNSPPYITPHASPVIPMVMDRRVERRMLSEPVKSDEVQDKLFCVGLSLKEKQKLKKRKGEEVTDAWPYKKRCSTVRMGEEEVVKDKETQRRDMEKSRNRSTTRIKFPVEKSVLASSKKSPSRKRLKHESGSLRK
jgi:hypothetical protein